MRMFMLMSTLSFLKFFSNIVYIDVFWSFQLLIDSHELNAIHKTIDNVTKIFAFIDVYFEVIAIIFQMGTPHLCNLKIK